MSRPLSALILVVALALAACDRAPPAYSGIDLTGAEFGRSLSLTDPDGRERTLADFRGKYVMIFFGYTHCPDVCPTALLRAVEVRKKLGADADRLQVIFVTVDPERDTAELIKAYTAAFDPTFLGLRGDLEHTRQAAQEFRVFFEKVKTGSTYAVNHSAITYILDPQGRLRLGMKHDHNADQYTADLRTLMKDSSN